MLDWIKRILGKDERPYVEPPGIGIAWLWKLPDSHPFQPAALKHDAYYDDMRAGAPMTETSELVDYVFYKDCLAIADAQPTLVKRLFYRLQAKLFYLIARQWGKKAWRMPGGKVSK